MITQIVLKDIESNPWQTRVGEPDEEYIKSLAYDIATNGLLQVPLGRRVGEQLQLAFGHNRLAAYKILADEDSQQDEKEGYDVMPVELRELTDAEMAQAAWSENEKRRDVSSIEKALAVQKRIEDFGWSQADAANNLGVDRSTVSNLLRLLKLPDDLRANIGKGEISERQAMALLPLFEAPEHRDNYSMSYYYANPEKIIQYANDGESSDKLRGRVDDYFKYVSKPLEKSGIKLDEIFTEGGQIYCGTCRACDKRMGSRNLCFLVTCFEAKQQYKKHEYLVSASISSGYPISDELKGGYVSEPYSDKMQAIRQAGCPNLCLVYQEGEAREPYDIQGFPHAHLACDKRNNSCSCEKGLNINAIKRIESKPPVIEMDDDYDPDEVDPDGPDNDGDDGAEEQRSDDEVASAEKVALPTSAELEEIARQAIEQHGKVHEWLVTMLIPLLRADDPGAFYAVSRGSIWANDDDLEIEKLYNYMARSAARLFIPSDYDSMTDLVQKTNRNLARLGLPAISLVKTLSEVFDTASAPEITLPTF